MDRREVCEWVRTGIVWFPNKGLWRAVVYMVMNILFYYFLATWAYYEPLKGSFSWNVAYLLIF